MSKKKKKKLGQDNVEVVESALSRTEQFIEDNQKILTIIVVAIVAIVGIYLGYKKWYMKPMNEEANAQIFMAEQYFERDSFNLALNGDGLNYGFLIEHALLQGHLHIQLAVQNKSSHPSQVIAPIIKK